MYTSYILYTWLTPLLWQVSCPIPSFYTPIVHNINPKWDMRLKLRTATSNTCFLLIKLCTCTTTTTILSMKWLHNKYLVWTALIQRVTQQLLQIFYASALIDKTVRYFNTLQKNNMNISWKISTSQQFLQCTHCIIPQNIHPNIQCALRVQQLRIE